MIVNPQFFNYRLIIGTLSIVVASLTIFGFVNYQSIQANQQFLEQEKNLVENELVEMINQYDDISESNNFISTQLVVFKNKARKALDSLQSVETNISLLSRFKQKIGNLKVKNKNLFQTIDSLNSQNLVLKKKNKSTYGELIQERIENDSLIKENYKLSSKLADITRITANSFKAKGYQKNRGIKSFTKKAKHVNSIEFCFTIIENSLAKSGKKDLYVQILDPKNNIIADKGEISFESNKLIYSQKISTWYNQKDSDICIDIQADKSDQPLAPGTYFISVFHEGKKLGGTKVEFR